MSSDARIRERSNELTLLAFMATLVMLFAAFTSAYLIRRTGADWQSISLPGLVWFNMVVLLASSVTVELARRRQSHRWLVMTVVLGSSFLAGQVLYCRDLAGEGPLLSTSASGAFTCMLSAVHGVHLLGGVLTLLYVSVRSCRVGLCAMYWHFMVGVWVYLVLMLSIL